MTPVISEAPDGGTNLIGRTQVADDREVEFDLPEGIYVRNWVSLAARLGNQVRHCTMETLQPDGETWKKGCPARLSGTVRVRLKDVGDSREVIIHTTKEAAA